MYHTNDDLAADLMKGRGDQFEQALRYIGCQILASELHSADRAMTEATAAIPKSSASSFVEAISETTDTNAAQKSAERFYAIHEQALIAANRWLEENGFIPEDPATC